MSTETIYDALRESHDIQRSLCRQLLSAPPDGGRRGEIYRDLKIELAAHAAAEERFLYAPMWMDDRGLDASRHAVSEHHQIDEYVEQLGKAEPQGGSWLAWAKKLAAEVRHHVDEEEKKFFQLSGKILTEAQKKSLVDQYRQDYARMKSVLAKS